MDEQNEPKKEETNVNRLIEMVERLERANKDGKEILRKQEELYARHILGGQTDAGVQPPQPKEETPKEYKERIMRGKL